MRSQLLKERIRTEIGGGAITFARFMEIALYEPDLGYYTSGRQVTGRKGDFFTNVSVGATFGHILALQFAEMWERLGRPASFWLVEQGAHDGQLASDILAAIEAGPFRDAMHLAIVEPSGSLRRLQQERLKSMAGIEWFESLEALPEFNGVHFSNELVDAFPFHLLEAGEEDWRELRVGIEGDAFVFRTEAVSQKAAASANAFPQRPSGYRTECRPAADEWLAAVEARLQEGYILVIDYGLLREDLLAPSRTKGTYQCYRDHRRDDNPLANVGEKDITAHVDFTGLARAAGELGLRAEGFADQHHFLVGASEAYLRALGPVTGSAQKTLRELQTLLHPETMGTQFHYLCFSKNSDESSPLAGFRHAARSFDRLKTSLEG